MKKSLTGILICFLFLTPDLFSQCVNWEDLDASKKDEAETLHVTYRDFIKREDYEGAFEFWKKVFDIAPAADGLRDNHFIDGIAIYKHKFKNAADEAAKKEAKDMTLQLYDQLISCYEAGSIKVPRCQGDHCIKEKMGRLYGDKAFDMYYTFNTPYSQTIEALDKGIELAGKSTLYTVFAPYANIVVYQFEKGNMDKDKARSVHAILNEIADHNVENNKDYGPYYKQAQDAMNGSFAKIESEIFDCAYFKAKLEPDYRANVDDPEVIKYVYNKLKTEGCDSTDALLMELAEKWSKYAEEENARLMAEFEAKNPSFAAKRLYDAGQFPEAIAKYREAIQLETDDIKKSEYWFRMASIQFRNQNQYVQARVSALNAAKLNPDWGRPHILIGEMYARSSNSCGKDAYERGLVILAAINKWAVAKSRDPEAADDANRLIARYSKFKPPKEEVFMRKTNGKVVKVGCWIGESVKVTL